MTPDPTAPAIPSEPHWNLAKRVLFRFAFVYFIVAVVIPRFFPLLIVQQLLDAGVRYFAEAKAQVDEAWGSVMGDRGIGAAREAWLELVRLVGAHVVRATEPVAPHPTGSGDTLFDWTQALTVGLIALLVTTVWSVLQRRTRAHPLLAAWLWIGARFFLASTMFGYGWAKVIKVQFGDPSLSRLIQPLGDMSPMGLVWTFMGFSTAYTVFSGVGEVLGGLLLCFRRTATLGALVVIGMMTNVVMINFCYDVPVKLYASFYLVIAFGIIAPDIQRLLAVLVFNRPTTPRDLSAPLHSLRHVFTVLTLAWIGVVAHDAIRANLDRYARQDGRELPALYGVFEVESFTRDGVEYPPLLTDGERWRYLVIDRKESISIRPMTGAAKPHSLVIDEVARTITLGDLPKTDMFGRPLPKPEGAPAEPEPEKIEYRFTYEETTPGMYTFSGDYAGHALVVKAKRRTRDDFLLTSREFNWINEDPFNR
jgi:uncharacterized membrane protein YphA (DoxX/SURF4 family)